MYFDYIIIVYKNEYCQLIIYTINEVSRLAEVIKIKKKAARRGEDGHKVVSVRMKDELIEKLDKLSSDSNRSRNELINILLDAAVDIVKIEE